MDETTLSKNHKPQLRGCSWGCVVKVFLCLLLAGIIWDTWLKPPVVWYWNINGVDLWIPRDYFEPKYVNPHEEDFSLEAKHDDFSPVNTTKLLTPDVRIAIANPRYYKPIDETLGLMVEDFEAVVDKGTQYGLTYLTQKPDNPKDWGEIWVEKKDGKLISFIECDKTKPIVPQGITICNQRFMHDGMYIELGFDKRQLSEWRYFKDRSIALIDSFRTKPTSYVTIIAIQTLSPQEK